MVFPACVRSEDRNPYVTSSCKAGIRSQCPPIRRRIFHAGAQPWQRCAGILSSPHLRELWYEDLQVMSGRIARMRRLLYDGLVAAGTPSPSGSWEHIIEQIGMFAFTGLTVCILTTFRVTCLICNAYADHSVPSGLLPLHSGTVSNPLTA